MNIWLWGATVLLLGAIPCGVVMLRQTPLEALVALELAGSLFTVVLLLLAEGFARSPYFVLALALPLLSFVSGLIFVRLFERVA